MVSNSRQAWVVCLIASLFFFYEFIQMNLFNAISQDLMAAFSINATGLSRMSAFYFVANVVFLFIAGTLLDRFSTRWVIMSALLICIIGTALFATAQTYHAAIFYRFLTGIGSAFCFLSVIRLATRWFPAKRLAFVIGVIVTVAMLGGVVAQKPLSWLISWMPWRSAIMVDAVLGVLILFLIALFVQDYPEAFHATRQLELREVRSLGYFKSLRLAFFNLQNWLCGIFTCLMNLPVIILGGLWGVAYLVQSHGVSNQTAPTITQMLFFGTIVGSPLAGWLSDHWGVRRCPMMLGAISSLVLIMILLKMAVLSQLSLLILFFGIGLLTSVQVISYSVVAESSLPAITAMSVSVVNISAQGGLALFEPLFGSMMDFHHVRGAQAAAEYLRGDFHFAMLIFVVGIAVAFFAALAIRETYCRSSRQEFI